MTPPLLIAKNNQRKLRLLPQIADRHGQITGVTATGPSKAGDKAELERAPGSLPGGKY